MRASKASKGCIRAGHSFPRRSIKFTWEVEPPRLSEASKSLRQLWHLLSSVWGFMEFVVEGHSFWSLTHGDPLPACMQSTA